MKSEHMLTVIEQSYFPHFVLDIMLLNPTT